MLEQLIEFTELHVSLKSSLILKFVHFVAITDSCLFVLGDIPDVSIQNIIVKMGSNGRLKVNWIGEMMQKVMLTSWERVQRNEDISVWRYDNENEIAVRLNRKFYATISSNYGIDEDGTLTIKAARKEDAGYYKFRLVCGRGFVKGLLVNFVVVD